MKKTLTLRNLVLMAMLIAISIILSRFLGFYIDPNSLRISFECAPMLLAGIWLGPIAGMLVGATADILGCFLSGYGLFLPLTMGPLLIGLISGLLAKYVFKNRMNVLTIAITCILAEFIGSMLVNTFALMLYSGVSDYFALFFTRLPFKLIIMTCDTAIVFIINKTLYKSAVCRFLKKEANA